MWVLVFSIRIRYLAYPTDRSLKFILSEKATEIDQIFTVDLTLCSKCQIDGENLVNFYGLHGKHEF